jgi:hypothetical protein
MWTMHLRRTAASTAPDSPPLPFDAAGRQVLVIVVFGVIVLVERGGAFSPKGARKMAADGIRGLKFVTSTNVRFQPKADIGKRRSRV